MADKQKVARDLDKAWREVKNELEHGDLGVEFDTIKQEVLDNLEFSVDGTELSADYTGYEMDAIEFELPDTTDLDCLIGEAVLALQADEESNDPYAVMHEAGFTRQHANAVNTMVDVINQLHVTLGNLTGNGLTCIGYGQHQITPEMLEDIRRIASNLAERLPAPVTDEASMT